MQPEGSEIDMAAAEWIAKLQSSDATDAEFDAFLAWLDADPAHASAFAEMAEVLDISAAALKARRPVTARGPMRTPSPRMARNRPRRRGRWLAVGAAVVIVLALTPAIMRQADRLRADHYTTIGARAEIALPDGTVASLDTDTAIDVQFDAARRHVIVRRGRAFFSVTEDPNRPFSSEAVSMTAKALGTRFSIGKQAERGPEVVLEEGALLISHENEATNLAAGQRATLGDEGQILTDDADIYADIAWRRGEIVFSGKPLGQVLDILDRYHAGWIIATDETARQLPVSGVFSTDDLDQTLTLIEASLPIRIRRAPAGLMAISSK